MSYCPNCGNPTQASAKFCNSCGLQLITSPLDPKPGFKAIVLNIFNLQKPKSFFESILLYIISLAIVIPIYFIVPLTNDTGTYLLNASISIILVLMVGLLKRLHTSAWLWALAAGVVGYLIGTYASLVVLIPVFMAHSHSDSSSLGQIEKDFVYAYFKKGIILYILGAVVTIGSYAFSQDNTYTIWYGAVIWGIITIFQGIYYQSHPDTIHVKANDYNKKKFWEVSTGFKKFLIYFLILVIVVSVIISLVNL